MWGDGKGPSQVGWAGADTSLLVTPRKVMGGLQLGRGLRVPLSCAPRSWGSCGWVRGPGEGLGDS